MTTFRVGQMVAYDGPDMPECPRYSGSVWPNSRAVYTICDITTFGEQQALRFDELPPPNDPKFKEWWKASHFRPVVTPSIEIFTAMLNSIQQDA